MKRIGLAVFACAFALVGCERSANVSAELRGLVEAERRFAKAAEALGVRAAFLANLADDAVIFRPQPVNGRQWYLDQPDSKALLSWEPVLADIASAGDLGYTTGPWTYSVEGAGVEPDIFGEYVSVWRRKPGARWQVVIDVGTVHEKPTSLGSTVAVPNRNRKGHRPSAGDAGTELDVLLGVDREFSGVSQKRGVLAALEEFAADDIKLCRMDAFPVTGKEGLRTVLGGENPRVSFEPISGGVSRSGDLGYTYGTGRIGSGRLNGGEEERESYLRIWVREPASTWKIVLDITNPVTATTEETGQ
ncbi:MAG: nuclear transport factor 2 family protein [Candidatus Latescibacterota bacterium]|nr:MAG: nuclear transport factor 2 family protein [Candidatus Latescibacterota bacterium]